MAQIHRKVMHEPLHVRPLLVPRCETMNGKRMAQVVNSRVHACLIGSVDARMVTQNSEIPVECFRVNRCFPSGS